jgi:hypothetical protein
MLAPLSPASKTVTQIRRLGRLGAETHGPEELAQTHANGLYHDVNPLERSFDVLAVQRVAPNFTQLRI